MATSLTSSAKVGNIGAYGFEKDKDKPTEEECHLVEFFSKPCLEQKTKTWLVDCHWLNAVPCARHWCTKSTKSSTVSMVCVVANDLEMIPFSPTNMIPARVRKAAQQKNAMKLSQECHDFIIDEISRREGLEHDPSRVFVGNESDSDSDDEEEEI